MAKDEKKKAPVTDFVAKRPDRYRVCEGKSVLTLKGMKVGKTDGKDKSDPIEAGDLSGGQADLDRLIENGHVEKYQ
jgi:hypothetical protein